MKPAKIIFPKSSTRALHPALGNGALINCHFEVADGIDRWVRCPGLVPFTTAGDPALKTRGLFFSSPYIYELVGSTLYQVDRVGVASAMIGSIGGDGLAIFSRNNAGDMVIVSSAGAFQASGSTITTYADPDLPTPESVDFLDGYFLFAIGDGRIFATDLNSVAVDALSFAKCEAKPDGLTRGVSFGQLFFGFGPDSTEVWQDVGTSPFPLGRVHVIPVGLAGKHAIAGHQSGWSGPLIFVASDNSVRALSGVDPQRISDADIEAMIGRIGDKSQLVANVYTYEGHQIWSLSSNQWTIEYNVTTGAWHERQSYEDVRWRTLATVNAFGRWFALDRNSNALFEVSKLARQEAGSPLIATMESELQTAFPFRTAVARADFTMIVGVGSETGVEPIETAPAAMVSWSDDGGNVFTIPRHVPIGRQGQYKNIMQLTRCGMASRYGRRWRVSVSDPIEFFMRGGTMHASAVAS